MLGGLGVGEAEAFIHSSVPSRMSGECTPNVSVCKYGWPQGQGWSVREGTEKDIRRTGVPLQR